MVSVKRLFLLMLMLFCCLLSACTAMKTDAETQSSFDEVDGPVTLWVLTEQSAEDKMNMLAKKARTAFREKNDNVKIVIDILPIDVQERKNYLEKLRVQIMAGDGPDIYLMPTDNTVEYKNGIIEMSTEVELLFKDVALAMRNGLFTDISEFYDNDEGLPKDRYADGIMEAGKLKNARYVVPIRFNFPVIYAETEKLNASGLDLALIESGIPGLYQTVLQNGEQIWASGAECIAAEYSLFPSTFENYNSNFEIAEKQILEFLKMHADIKTLRGSDIGNRSQISGLDYVEMDMYYWRFGYPMRIHSLDNMLEYAAMAKGESVELSMIPLRGIDGTLTAEITYWGAISACCEHPELAYEYLRLFLLEETQWETTRMKSNHQRHFYQTPGLAGEGWPILVEGSVEPMWAVIQDQNKINSTEGGEGRRERKSKFQGAKLTDKDCQIIYTRIDNVYFPVVELDDTFAEVRNELTINSDFEAEANKLIEQLEWHIAEG